MRQKSLGTSALCLRKIFRDQTLGARPAGASVTKTSQLLGDQRGTKSKITTAYTQSSKTRWTKQNGGQKVKLSERDRLVLKRILTSKKRKTTSKVIAELSRQLDSPVSMISIRSAFINVSFTVQQQFPSHLSQILMPNVFYSSGALTKPARLISVRKLSDELCLSHFSLQHDEGTFGRPLHKHIIVIVSIQLLSTEEDRT
ncbi:hypothetical protein TNCV_864601 [Trichonephila clavipes]|nr:hypothetical protein TNCV_864601 [Trichonephila clavipes]